MFSSFALTSFNTKYTNMAVNAKQATMAVNAKRAGKAYQVEKAKYAMYARFAQKANKVIEEKDWKPMKEKRSRYSVRGFTMILHTTNNSSVSSRDVIIVLRHYAGARKDIAYLMFTV